MVFWLVLGLMTAAAIAIVVRPLLRRAPSPAADADGDLAVYRDQLAEIDVMQPPAGSEINTVVKHALLEQTVADPDFDQKVRTKADLHIAILGLAVETVCFTVRVPFWVVLAYPRSDPTRQRVRIAGFVCHQSPMDALIGTIVRCGLC